MAGCLRLDDSDGGHHRATLSIGPVLGWLKVIRSVSMGPSAIHETGHFYFAQTGHSHFAATLAIWLVDH